MNATEELRRLLDERGIEHYDHDHRDVRVTEWDNGGKRDARYEEWSSGTVRFDASNVTPEQAIAATLGRETCHVKASKKMGDTFGFGFVLSCGHSMVNPFDDHPDYCPWCGRKVVDE